MLMTEVKRKVKLEHSSKAKRTYERDVQRLAEARKIGCRGRI